MPGLCLAHFPVMQRDPLVEYKIEGYNLFLEMSAQIRRNVIYNVYCFQPQKATPQPAEQQQQQQQPRQQEQAQQQQEQQQKQSRKKAATV